MKKVFLVVAAITAVTGFGTMPANAAQINGKAAAHGGLDLTAGAFYAGIVPVGVKTQGDSGVEVDLYAGLAGYVDRDLSVNDQSKNTSIFGITKNFSILQ